jgi:hypothetical protein
MRIIGLALLAALLPAAALAQPGGGAFEIRTWTDPETGERVSSSAGNGDVKLRQGYSAAAESQIVLWVEARQAGTEPPRVYIVGQQLRYTLPKETKGSAKYGRGDPKDPAYVGTPFRKVDLQTRWTEVTCTTDAYYCNRVDAYEIALSDALVKAFTASDAGADFPVALTRRNRIDWRVPRAELAETLAALNRPAAE